MNSIKALVVMTVFLAISVAANTYFIIKQFSKDNKTEVRAATIDEPIVMRTKGGLLEVSTVAATESFERAEIHTLLNMDVAKTTARIRVPAVYRYHIELAPEWKITLRDKTFIVVTPPVKPSLPVAIDTAKLESESSGTWSIVTGTDTIAALQRSITPTLANYAAGPRYINLQRESARKTVTEFVQKWVASQERWKASSDYQVRVFFADEPIGVFGGLPPPRTSIM